MALKNSKQTAIGYSGWFFLSKWLACLSCKLDQIYTESLAIWLKASDHRLIPLSNVFSLQIAVFEQTWCQNSTRTSINFTTTYSTSTLQSTSQKPNTTARQSTTSSKPYLVCENKGTLQNGICLCPDDWTGTICNIGKIHWKYCMKCDRLNNVA